MLSTLRPWALLVSFHAYLLPYLTIAILTSISTPHVKEVYKRNAARLTY